MILLIVVFLMNGLMQKIVNVTFKNNSLDKLLLIVGIIEINKIFLNN